MSLWLSGQGTIPPALTTSKVWHLRFIAVGTRPLGTSRPQLYCGPASRRGHYLALLTGCQACKHSCMLHSTLQFFQLHHTNQLHQFPPSTTSIPIATTSISKHNYINFHCQLHQFPLPPHQCPISTTSISIAHFNSMLHQFSS